ncbi:MAG: hypothetical protein ACREL6_11660 [Gemmatimonadales bacterium]
MNAIFTAEGEARSWSRAGDTAAAIEALNRPMWLAAWEHAVQEAAIRAGVEVTRRLRLAAAESRMPRRRLEQVLPTPDEVHVTAARFGSGGAGFVESLAGLEESVEAVLRHESGSVADWNDALLRVARRLEAAWLSLEAAAAREWTLWAGEFEAARRWRRPRLPLWLVTAGLLGITTWLGLVLGGFLRSPGWFRPVLEGFWSIVGAG